MASAIATFCSTSNTVMPASRNCRMLSNNCRVSTGDKPSESSSTIKTIGSDMMPRPTASICCSPPLNVPDFWARRSFRRGNITYTCSRFCFIFGRARRLVAPISRFSSTVISVNNWRPSGTSVSPISALTWAGSRLTSRPSNQIEPPSGCRRPITERSMVVLPTPLPPTRQVNFFSCKDRLTPHNTCTSP